VPILPLYDKVSPVTLKSLAGLGCCDLAKTCILDHLGSSHREDQAPSKLEQAAESSAYQTCLAMLFSESANQWLSPNCVHWHCKWLPLTAYILLINKQLGVTSVGVAKNCTDWLQVCRFTDHSHLQLPIANNLAAWRTVSSEICGDRPYHRFGRLYM